MIVLKIELLKLVYLILDLCIDNYYVFYLVLD